MKKPDKPEKKRPRNAIKAVIIRGDKILVLRKEDSHGAYCVLPGGGQKSGETLEQALQRECLEEIGVPVKVKALLCVRDYIRANHGDSNLSVYPHKVEFYFACSLPKSAVPANGKKMDPTQLAPDWIRLSDLAKNNFYPKALADWLNAEPSSRPLYLGDVN